MKSVLENIKSSVENLSWSNETKKQKAIDLCISIYNLYVYDGGDFNHYKRLSKEYFKKTIKSNLSYVYEIKNNLINNHILIPHYSNSYDVEKGKGKGYRFNPDLINGNYVVLSGTKTINEVNQVVLSGTKHLLNNISNLNFSINKSISNLNYLELYHICGPKLETFINKGFKRLTFNPQVNDWINNYKLKRTDILINNEIKEDYINLKLENDDWRISLEKSLEMAKEQNKDLILYKDNAYIENENDFIERKERELKLIFKKNVFEVENKIFRISRNETNRRLDYNLTNMKSELLNYLEIDGEPLIELDIANAQFALLSYLIKDLDDNFISKTQNGTLYKNDKKKWFRIAFDKIKKEQDEFRNLYPKTMNFIDNYKKQYGYKSLSNLLQNLESLIMIDGLLPKLLNFDVFPIHDAIRVKKSQVDEVKKIIENYFNEIGFKCLLRIKNKKENHNIEEIKYKDKLTEIEEDLFWENWNPKKVSQDRDEIVDKDWGESDGIPGFIETI